MNIFVAFFVNYSSQNVPTFALANQKRTFLHLGKSLDSNAFICCAYFE